MSFGVLLLIALLAWIAIGALLLRWGARSLQSGSHVLVRKCASLVVPMHDQATVRLCTKAPRPSADDLEEIHVVLVIDNSGSMGEGPGSPLDNALQAASSFVETALPDEDRTLSDKCHISIVRFDDTAQVLNVPKQEKAELKAAIQGIPGGGGTAIEAGLAQAHHALVGLADSLPNYTRVVVLISDGKSNWDQAVEEAVALKESGVRIITVGLGPYVNESLLKEIASAGTDYTKAERPEDLGRIYRLIASTIGKQVGYKVEITESIATKNFFLVDTGDAAPASVNFLKGRVEWYLPKVGAKPVDIPYRIAPRRPGWYKIADKAAKVRMEDSEGNLTEGHTRRNPRLLVVPGPWYMRHIWALLLNPLFWLIAGLFRKERRAWLVMKDKKILRKEHELPEPQTVRAPLPRPTTSEMQPALVIGLGHTGRLVLNALKYHVEDWRPRIKERPSYLLIDTGDGEGSRADSGDYFGEHVEGKDQIILSDSLEEFFEELLAAEKIPPHLRWINPRRDMYQLTSNDFDMSRGARGRRVLGRAALFHHLQQAEREGRASALLAALDERIKALGDSPRIVVVANMSGGTGGAMLVDLLVLLRKRLKALGASPRALDALLLDQTLEVSPGLDLHRNARAFVTELNRLSLHGELLVHVPHDAADTEPVRDLADRVLVLERSCEPVDSERVWPWFASESAAEVLLHLLLGGEGVGPDHYLRNSLVDKGKYTRSSGELMIHGTGVASRRFPAREVLEYFTERTALNFLAQDLLRLEELPDRFAPLQDEALSSNTVAALEQLLDDSELASEELGTLQYLGKLSNPVTFEKELPLLAGNLIFYPETEVGFDIHSRPLIAEILKQQQNRFLVRLGDWTLALLNGLGPVDGTYSPDLKRGAFFTLKGAVDELHTLMEGVIENLENFEWEKPRVVDPKDRHAVDFLRLLFKRYNVLVSGYRSHLQSWLDLLVGGRVEANRRNAPEPVMHRLRESARTAKHRLSDLSLTLSPTIAWSEDIEREIAEELGSRVQKDMLVQAAWDTDLDEEQNSLKLRLRIEGREQVKIGEGDHAPTEVVAHLRELARDLGLHEIEDIPLSKYMSVGSWVQGLQLRSPLALDAARHSSITDSTMQTRDFVISAEDLHGIHGKDLVKNENPHRASIFRIAFPAAISATDGAMAGTREHRKIFLESLPFLHDVDRIASLHEELLEDYGLESRTVGPVLRKYFVDPRALRASLLALALRLYEEVGDVETQIALFGHKLTQPQRRETAKPRLIEALDNLIVTREGAGTAGPLPMEEILSKIDQEMRDTGDDELAGLIRSFGDPVPPIVTECARSVRPDIITLTRLFLEQERLMRREKAGVAE